MSSTQRKSSIFGSIKTLLKKKPTAQGASVAILRGNSGADFEGPAKVRREDYTPGCMCYSNDKSASKVRYVLIKGNSCFVFSSKEDTSPKFAIPLCHLKVELEEPQRDQTAEVIFKSGLGDVEYRFTFDLKENPNAGNDFKKAASAGAAQGTVLKAKERLGHKVQLRGSVVYAEMISNAKAKDQPEKQDTLGEITDGLAMIGNNGL